jgi:hypothetical protein
MGDEAEYLEDIAWGEEALLGEDFYEVQEGDYNFELQYYKGIPLRLVNMDYTDRKAKRYSINDTIQKLWIPNKYLTLEGTIRPHANLDFKFRGTNIKHILKLAGVDIQL